LGDIWPIHQLAYVIGIWALGAVAGKSLLHIPSDTVMNDTIGPIVGPVIGGFPAQANGWRWPIYELIWISGFALVFLALFLPETYEPTILLRRAERLRKLTGNPHLRSQSEINEASTSASDRLYEALVRPFILAAEPALLFANLYLGFVCQ
jgi:MFS transporter, DHA1 family, multidrug resistance protein